MVLNGAMFRQDPANKRPGVPQAPNKTIRSFLDFARDSPTLSSYELACFLSILVLIGTGASPAIERGSALNELGIPETLRIERRVL